MIGILNYGSGNVTAISHSLQKNGIDSRIISTISEFSGISRMILPGVGAFSSAMKKLNNSGLRVEFERHVQVLQLPVLGICVGLQMLFENSEEGEAEGLGLISGKVIKLKKDTQESIRLPHIGWNQLHINKESHLFKKFGNQENPEFYFLHSYVINPLSKDVITASAFYESSFPVSVESNNIFGVQFHPEKSHKNGADLLKNYANVPTH